MPAVVLICAQAPTLDGKVLRDQGGNEVRYPVVLSYEEKVIANKIVAAFGQFICGFDVLRSLTGELVCAGAKSHSLQGALCVM